MFAVELRDVAAKAAVERFDAFEPDELMAAARDVEIAIRHLDATRAHVLAALDASGATDTEHGMRTAGWVAREARQHGDKCRRRVRLARRLREFDVADQALVDGRIGWDHIEVLDRIANPRIAELIVELEPELVALAEPLTFDQWSHEVRAIAEQLDADGGYRPETDPTRNALRLSSGLDGDVHLDGRFTGEAALELRGLLDEATDRVWRRYRSLQEHEESIEMPGRAQLMAEALLELTCRGSASDVASTAPPRPDVTVVVRPDGRGRCRAEMPDGTSVRFDLLEAILRRTDQVHGVTLREDGSSEGAAVLLDGLDPDGPIGRAIVLALGMTDTHEHDRGPRFATRAHRRAAAARDGGCVFPGCEMPIVWCDLHHVVWWERGGRTVIENLAPLCRFHHGVTHRAAWTMRATDDQWFWWETPSGSIIWSQRHGRQRAGPWVRAG